MKAIHYSPNLKCKIATPEEVDEFALSFQAEQGTSCSKAFLDFCIADNGGLVESAFREFAPDKSQKLFHEKTYFDGVVLIKLLYGLSSEKRFSFKSATSNAREVWGLDSAFYVIASDPFGLRLVSKLRDSDDSVYLWDPSFEPEFLKIADSLAGLYSGIAEQGQMKA